MKTIIVSGIEMLTICNRQDKIHEAKKPEFFNLIEHANQKLFIEGNGTEYTNTICIVGKNSDFIEGRGPMHFHKTFKSVEKAIDYIMTRINVVPIASLSGSHLCAEYRELPRVFALAHKASVSSKPWTDKQPKSYTMGTGHVIWFYDKLGFLAKRHSELVKEMLSRGYKPTMTACLKEQWQDKIPSGYWKDYVPTEAALQINKERIDKRLSGDKS